MTAPEGSGLPVNFRDKRREAAVKYAADVLSNKLQLQKK